MLLCVYGALVSNVHAVGLFSIIKKVNADNRIKAYDMSNHFFTVDAGKLYRSQQLSDKELEYYVKKHGIKTVINLRGSNEGQQWWQNEKAATERLGLQFFSLSFDHTKLTPQATLQALLQVYDTAPQPILIHCRQGRDRTGEAAALWILTKKIHGTKQEALDQLSFIPYLHTTALHPAKRFLIEIWQGREWLNREYDHTKYIDCI